MAIFFIKAAQLMFALAVLVLIHELGHFTFAKLFKVRVDKFYLFFNPQISIFRLKKINGKLKFKFFAKNLQYETPILDEKGAPKLDKKGKKIMQPVLTDALEDDDWRKYPANTEWGLGWIPLGGYCKIGGMMDESMDKNVKNIRNEKWAYESHPVWQRMLIDAGGVIFNFVSAVIIFAMMAFNYGKEPTIQIEDENFGYLYCQTAKNHGFIDGDRVVSIDCEKVNEAKDVFNKIILKGKTNIVLLRDNQEIKITLPKSFRDSVLNAGEKMFMTERFPFVIDSVLENSLAEITGLRKGDSIVGINSKQLFEAHEISNELAFCKGKKININFYRNGELFTDSLIIDESGKLGVGYRLPYTFFKSKKVNYGFFCKKIEYGIFNKRTEYGFFESFFAGWDNGVSILSDYISQFSLVFTKTGAKNLGGFGTIGSIFPPEWNWTALWSMTAFLSVILAFMNILPIPVLDGGHLLFLFYELIFRRRPSDKFMEISLTIGLYLLIALMIFANGNDILKWLGLM
jgi:regulator of sigma E protease